MSINKHNKFLIESFNQQGLKKPSHLLTDADNLQGRSKKIKSNPELQSKTGTYVGVKYKIIIDEFGVEQLVRR